MALTIILQRICVLAVLVGVNGRVMIPSLSAGYSAALQKPAARLRNDESAAGNLPRNTTDAAGVPPHTDGSSGKTLPRNTNDAPSPDERYGNISLLGRVVGVQHLRNRPAPHGDTDKRQVEATWKGHMTQSPDDQNANPNPYPTNAKSPPQFVFADESDIEKITMKKLEETLHRRLHGHAVASAPLAEEAEGKPVAESDVEVQAWGVLPQ